MKYNGNINYIKCMEYELSIIGGAIMDLMTHLPLWAKSEVIDGKIYYYFSANKILEELPIISESKRTILHHVKILKDKGLIEHKIYKNKGYYALTDAGKSFVFSPENNSLKDTEKTAEKDCQAGVQKMSHPQEECAKNCTPGMQNFAHNNNTSNNIKNNNISKDILLQKRKENFKNPEKLYQEIQKYFSLEFFEKLKMQYEIDDEVLKSSARKFYEYWTEKNPNGRKERWQMEKVFDVRRRFKKWLDNEKSYRKTFTTKPRIG